mmetsp:Transcript_11919/g.22075  ORF Transcript_11919/g.22075 Transcript_11919/m.22075 type:complete len:196 (+) Transcript_11919:248-835(+)
MPENYRERQLTEEGKRFCSTESCYPQPCKHFKPTLEELQSTTFSDYVRNKVLRESERGYDDEAEEEEEEEIVKHRITTRKRKVVSEKTRRDNSNSKDYKDLNCCIPSTPPFISSQTVMLGNQWPRSGEMSPNPYNIQSDISSSSWIKSASRNYMMVTTTYVAPGSRSVEWVDTKSFLLPEFSPVRPTKARKLQLL